ncbi:MAG: ATP-binding protein [Nitrospirota bacterium]|nr:ATP-binding protein [Nitrospirota bacterium]MDH5699219.1 ATP-binding protein [Nitrospirota bacterium]
MIKLPNTLSFRLTLWYASAFLVCFVAALVILYVSTQSILNGRLDTDLKEDIADFQEFYEEGNLKHVIQEIEREMASSEDSEIFFRLFTGDGHALFSSEFSYWKEIDAGRAPLARPPSQPMLETRTISSQDYPVRIVTGQIGPDVVLQIGESQGKIHEIMQVFVVVLGAIIALGIPLACGVGWLIARQAVAGIEEVGRAARDLGKGELDRRVTFTPHGEEIQSLADTFNAMAERIQRLIQEMREMTDNIAHDLRSPIARIRAMSETAMGESFTNGDYHKIAGATLKECDRLMQMINTTLDMAEIEAGASTQKNDRVDFSRLVTDLCELFEPLTEEKGIQLSLSLEPDCYLVGHKQNLQRMVANLLDNAVKYTGPKGTVRVTLSRQNSHCGLAIADTGVGIPSSDLNRVFDRFFRCDHSRSPINGCGLGLSFAWAVAKSHGGDIHVTSELHKGSTFSVDLPVEHVLR